MTSTQIITNILELITGLGIFMVAIEFMSNSLQSLSTDKLKKLFLTVSKSKIVSILIGTLTTILVNSSGITTVMLIGFVSSNIMSLEQAATIMLGSEIGTTLTGQIVALGMFGSDTVSMNVIFGALVGVGAFINLVASKDKTKSIAGVLIGLGMVFAALDIMNAAMDAFSQLQILKDFIALIKSPLLLIIIGAVLTAIIQSSTAMTTIAITMIAAGLITIEQGVYITLGANVGSCVTGALAAIASDIPAKQTSMFQMMFNIFGVLVVYIFDIIIKAFSGGSLSFSIMLQDAFPGLPATQLAMFHSLFNIITAFMFLPAVPAMCKMCKATFKEDSSDKKDEGEHLYYFNENMMSTPAVAVGIIKNEIINMAELAITNFNRSISIVTKLDFKEKEDFEKTEDELDYLNNTLVPIIARLSKVVTNAKDSAYLSSSYRVISDLERIGDYAENIVEYAEYLKDTNQKFSDKALKEIADVTEIINQLYSNSISVYTSYNERMMKKAFELEDKVDELTRKMNENHIKRMEEGLCNAEVGSQYLQLTSNVERIADHLININDKDYIIAK